LCNNDKNLYSVLVACAMKVEADIFINKLVNVNEVSMYGFKFYEGVYNDLNVVILVSNPGLVNMSSALSLAIIHYNPGIIFNFGVVGGIGENIHQGDVIICNECLNIGSYLTGILSEGMGVDIHKWEFLTFTDGDIDKLVFYKANAELLMLISKFKDRYLNGNFYIGRIGSSDVWDREYDKLLMLRNEYDIICEDMECVSVYQVAGNFNIPTISLKVVSDNYFLGEVYDKNILVKSADFVYFIFDNICVENLLKNKF